MLIIKKISQTGERITDKLEEHEIARLYKLYIDTYSPIGGAILNFTEFKKSINPQEGNCKYNPIIIIENQNEISHCFLLRTTPFGTRISFAFGTKDNNGREQRLSLLKKMLHSGYYAEASGAVAKQLLKDDTIKLLMSPDSNYYAGLRTTHGKKLVFGAYKNASEVHPKTKRFIFYLYAYIALKHSIENNNEPNALAMYLYKLKELYTTVHHEKDIPDIYKLILLSKIARKIHFIEPSQGSKQLNYLNNFLSEALACTHANETLLLFSNKLSSEEQQFVDSILHEKKIQLEEKVHMTFFKNYASLSANESSPTLHQLSKL